MYFVPLPPQATPEKMAAAARALWKTMDARKIVRRQALVAIKMHFGEEGGRHFVPPEVARALGECIREAGGKPFATDSNTLYNGMRANAVDHLELARRHGFSHEALGFPVIIADGLRGESQVIQEGPGEVLPKVFLSGVAAMTDAAVVVTHVTGHLAAGVGASIKNVAMGFAGRAGKLAQHHGAAPLFSRDRCRACGRCARHCPASAITVREYARLEAGRCIGCGECFAFCPYGAVTFEWAESGPRLQKKMAEYCLAFHREKAGRVIYLNFVTQVTRQCDCMASREKPLPDLGVLGSTDPVAVDAAAIEQLNAREGRDVFRTFWPQFDPWGQIEHGERIGLGTRRYRLVVEEGGG